MRFYVIKTKFGSDYEITQEAYKKISDLLLMGRDTRPQFLEITGNGNVILNTDSIAAIEPYGINDKKESCEL